MNDKTSAKRLNLARVFDFIYSLLKVASLLPALILLLLLLLLAWRIHTSRVNEMK